MFIYIFFFLMGYYSCISYNKYSLNINLNTENTILSLFETKLNSLKKNQDKIFELVKPEYRSASP
jgi:hypothetical protein